VPTRTLNTLIAFAVWLAIILFFFGGWIAFLEITSPPHRQQEQGNTQASNNSRPANPGVAPIGSPRDQASSNGGDTDSDTKTTDWIQAGSAIAIVLLTGFIVCIYRRQTNVMAKQAGVMGEQARVMRVQASTMINQTSILTESLTVSRNSFGEARKATEAALLSIRSTEANNQRELRAYVTVSEGRILDPRDPTKRRAIIKATNCGQTPAYDQTIWISTAARPYPLTVDLTDKAPEAPLGKRILGPGQETVIDCPVGPFSGGIEVRIAESKAAVLVYGEIRYRDAFNEDRVTKYRFFCQGDGMLDGRLSPDIGGNEAT
jgi:hypothetical protein